MVNLNNSTIKVKGQIKSVIANSIYCNLLTIFMGSMMAFREKVLKKLLMMVYVKEKNYSLLEKYGLVIEMIQKKP